jgi:transcriptional repressor NrdR
MKCPKCGSKELKVIEKRDLPAEGSIRRRRECLSCSNRFTTYEKIEVPALLSVKKSGEKEPYVREKMAAGFYKALEKRPFKPAEVERMIDEVDHQIQTLGIEEVRTSKIGDLVSAKLKETDEVAYLRFVSVYKSFDDARAFQREVNQVMCGKDDCSLNTNDQRPNTK